MIGILVTSYGELPGALARTAEAILGQQKALESVAVRPQEGQEEIANHLYSAVGHLREECDAILVLAGIYGESNCTLCQSLFAGQEIQIVTGVNLPMLFKALTYRNALPLDQLAQQVCQGGQDGIRIIRPGVTPSDV